MRTIAEEKDPIEPRIVHPGLGAAARFCFVFLLMLAFGLVPVVVFLPSLIDSFRLSLFGQESLGRVVAVEDRSDQVSPVNRTDKLSTSLATIEFRDQGTSRRFDWMGWMHEEGPSLKPKHLPMVGDALPVRFLASPSSLAKVDRFSEIWLPQLLLWLAGVPFVVFGLIMSRAHVAGWQRGRRVRERGIRATVTRIEVVDDDSYTDGKHRLCVAHFSVADQVYLSRIPTSRKTPPREGQLEVRYLAEDPSINMLKVDP